MKKIALLLIIAIMTLGLVPMLAQADHCYPYITPVGGVCGDPINGGSWAVGPVCIHGQFPPDDEGGPC